MKGGHIMKNFEKYEQDIELLNKMSEAWEDEFKERQEYGTYEEDLDGFGY